MNIIVLLCNVFVIYFNIENCVKIGSDTVGAIPEHHKENRVDLFKKGKYGQILF